MKPFVITKLPMAFAILAVVAWTWTIATLFFGDNPQPAQAATVSVSAQDSLQVFLVMDSARVLLEEETQLTVGGKAVGYRDKVVPLPLEVEVHNATSDWLAMQVTVDAPNGVVPIFGDVHLPESDASVNLAPKGAPGSGVMGLLDFQLQQTGSLRRVTSIEFTTRQAGASQQPSLPTSLGFEDDSLGMLCSFVDLNDNDEPIVNPIRDEFLESHGVSFRGGDPDDGLAVLHECSTGETGLDSHGGGDYFLMGNERADLATGGFPELPLTATFTQPVTQVSLWAAAGVRSGPDTLSMKLTAYANAGGAGGVVATSSLDGSMQWQQLSVQAPENKSFKSAKLTNESDVHSYLVDDMEWTWAREEEEIESPEEGATPPSCLGVSTASSP